MRSRDRLRRGSLRTRVAVASAILAALVGAAAAGVSAALVQRLELASHDERLTDAASLMERELASEGGDPRRHVDEEAVEIAPVGLHIALFENRERTAGARDVPYADVGCSSRSIGATQWRTCGSGELGQRIVVGMPLANDAGGLPTLLFAVAGATLLAMAIGVFVSRMLATWALAPLTALGSRIERITDATDGEPDLGDASGSVEVDALREAIRSLVTRLGEVVDRSRGFAASAAHELRTPLATMMAELELAAEESPQSAEALARVQRTARRLSVLVERLLVIASGSTVRVNDAVAMEDVVRETVAARRKTERVRIVTKSEASGIVRGDEELLRVVVDNLIDNALKFGEPGNVMVEVIEDGPSVVVSVRDEGPGIDPAEAERLLRAFTRGSSAAGAVVPGHGVGLSIVAHGARIHGGEVVFVRRDIGAEVKIVLPIWKAAAVSDTSSRGRTSRGA